MSQFQWNTKRSQAAILLADGYTIEETAENVGASSRTINRWKNDIEFITEVDRLSLMVGIANRGERLRIAKRIIRNKVDPVLKTQKDLLEWLKYAQSETDGVKLDFTAFFDTATSVAGSGQDGVDREEADEVGDTDPEIPE